MSADGWTAATLDRLGIRRNGVGFLFPNDERYDPDGDPKMIAPTGKRRKLWPDPADVDADVVLLVEGRPDVVSAAELGFAAVSVPMARKLTDDEARRIMAGRQRAYVVPDCDTPGREKARQSAETCAKYGATFLADLDPGRTDGFDVGEVLAEAGDADLGRTFLCARLDDAEHVYAPEEHAPASANGPLTVRASDVSSKVIRWLWRGRLAFGYVTVGTGLEKIGKTTFWCWVIGGLTRGDLDGGPDEPVDVLILANEDGIEDTWKPRLAVARAELARCHFIRTEALGDGWNLRDGAERLREAITGTTARLLLVDAVLEHLPESHGGNGENSAVYVRRTLGPLRRVLHDCGLAGVISMHPPKGRNTGEFRDMVQTSQAWTAISRLGLLVAYHPDDAELPEDDRRRVVLRGGANRGRNPGALEFRIVGVDHVHDDGNTEEIEQATEFGPCKVTMRDLSRVAETEKPTTKAGKAAALLRVVLGDGKWHDSADAYALLDAMEFGAKATVAEARKLAGVEVRKVGFGEGWQWRLKAPLVKTTEPSAHARGGSIPNRTFDVENPDPSPRNAGSSEGSVVLNETPNYDAESAEGSVADSPRAHSRTQDGAGQGELLGPPDRTGGRDFSAQPDRPRDDDEPRERYP